MTIQQVMDEFHREKQLKVPSRYPCRAIMVKNVEQYCQLLSELKKIADVHIVDSTAIFSSADVLPKYENLKGEEYRDQWVILTGVSEYLRLFSKKEAADKRFLNLWSYQAPASSVGRIIIPLWGCEAQWFDPALGLNNDERQEEFFYNCSEDSDPEQDMSILVLSNKFESYWMNLKVLQASQYAGLQEWFEYWENPEPNNKQFVLLTKRYNRITQTNGNVSVRVIDDTLAFIREHMPEAKILTSDNCPEDAREVLFPFALEGVSLSQAILESLNVSAFSGTDVMRKWDSLPTSHKALASIWMKTYPDGSYLSHCFSRSKVLGDIPFLIEHEIFSVCNEKKKWICEYQELMKALGHEPDQSFFDELDAIPEYENRLDFITGSSREEKIYLLRMAGQWMRKDPVQVCTSEKLQNVYPELAAYLRNDLDVLHSDIGNYISTYKSYKLTNTLPQDENVYFNGIETEHFESRYSVLSEYIEDETVVLWIDALGIEWLSLLNWGLINHGNSTIKHIEITQATLPTETCYNDQWNVMDVPHEKLDKLDKLAHKGVIDEPDYYSCIENQLEFVSKLYKKVAELMHRYHRVIITGDHGTSRLAARFFHNREGITPPAGAEVGGHGRFCKLAENGQIMLPSVRVAKSAEGVKYAVFSNYDHFRRSGFAAGGDDENAIYGEVHGGATPEEMLVPVIVIDSNVEIALRGQWVKNVIKISMRKARLQITFNKPVSQLIVNIGNESGLVTSNENGLVWSVVFSHIKEGTYPVEVYADNRIVSMPEVTIKPALGGGMGDLP